MQRGAFQSPAITQLSETMAFLCTFSGMMAAGLLWMALFVGFGEFHNAVLNTIAEWLSPMGVVGWAFFAVLSVACSWLTYLLLRSKLGGVGPNHTT